jgi:hypothetical protein
MSPLRRPSATSARISSSRGVRLAGFPRVRVRGPHGSPRAPLRMRLATGGGCKRGLRRLDAGGSAAPAGTGSSRPARCRHRPSSPSAPPRFRSCVRAVPGRRASLHRPSAGPRSRAASRRRGKLAQECSRDRVRLGARRDELRALAARRLADPGLARQKHETAVRCLVRAIEPRAESRALEQSAGCRSGLRSWGDHGESARVTILHPPGRKVQ